MQDNDGEITPTSTLTPHRTATPEGPMAPGLRNSLVNATEEFAAAAASCRSPEKDMKQQQAHQQEQQ